jgi:hypothetical protein
VSYLSMDLCIPAACTGSQASSKGVRALRSCQLQLATDIIALLAGAREALMLDYAPGLTLGAAQQLVRRLNQVLAPDDKARGGAEVQPTGEQGHLLHVLCSLNHPCICM